MEGELDKRSHRFPFVWQHRYFKAVSESKGRGSYVAYYKDKAHSTRLEDQKGIIYAADIVSIVKQTSKTQECRMYLEVKSTGRKYSLKAKSPQVADRWIDVISGLMKGSSKGPEHTRTLSNEGIPPAEIKAMQRVEASAFDGLKYFTKLLVTNKERFQGFALATEHDGYFDVAVFPSHFMRFFKLVSALPNGYSVDSKIKLDDVSSIDHAQRKFMLYIKEAHKKGLRPGLRGEEFDKYLTEAASNSAEGLQEFIKAAQKYEDKDVESKLTQMVGFFKTMQG